MKESAPVRVVWEMNFDCTPPPSFSLNKPKFWLCQRLKLQKGTFYELIAPPLQG